ncbi:MAG: signal peptidase II [Desulfobacterales bacterium]
MSPWIKKYARLPMIAGLVVIADQLTKWWVLQGIGRSEVIPVIPGFFNLVHWHNPGGAFGFFAGQGSQVRALFFIFFSLLAVALIFYLYRSTPAKYKWLLSGFSLIVGGAVGNLIDRIRFGHVVDFIDLYIGTVHWPAFNVADSAITIGMFIFAVYLITKKYPVE